MCNTQNVKISKEMGSNYQLYFWHNFITWVVMVGGREIQRKSYKRKFVKKCITIAKFEVSPLVDDGQPV
jgi:hypothetical protein